jgi:hypothetical protein
MAFTYAVVTVNNLAVGDQIRAAVAADGHAYVYPVPTTGGATFPTTVRAIFPSAVPPGTDSGGNPVTNTSVLWTIQLNNGSVFNLPTDFTLNATTDFVIRATGTA